MGWFLIEVDDPEKVKYILVIATGVYLFIMCVGMFYSLYKIARISNNKRFKNFFLFSMGVLLRIPYQSTVQTSYSQDNLTFKRVWEEIRKDLLIMIVVTLWFIVLLIMGYYEIRELKQ